MRQSEPSAFLIALPIIFILIIITLVIVAAILLTDILGIVGLAPLPTPTPQPHPAPSPIINPLFASDDSQVSFHSTALGFALEYPFGWQKKEKMIEVVFSPSPAGLDPQNLQDSMLWLGIPAGDMLDHGDILRSILVKLPPPVQVSKQSPMNLASTQWTAVEFSFGDPVQGVQGQGIAAAATKNEVGYFIVAAAPAEQWASMQPVLQQTLNSFRFTEEAVLRPTDATPPPTPTPTPTPVIYVVQSGDTLLGIAIQFDVDVDTLAARNGIEVPENLRTGQRLIIPSKR